MSESTPKKKVAPTATSAKASAKVKSAEKAAKKSTTPPKKTAAAKADQTPKARATATATSAAEKVTGTAKAAADRAVGMVGGFELPSITLPKVDIPKVEIPKVEIPESVSAIADRGTTFVHDSVKSAQQTAESVRKNVSQTVVLVREAVGI